MLFLVTLIEFGWLLFLEGMCWHLFLCLFFIIFYMLKSVLFVRKGTFINKFVIWMLYNEVGKAIVVELYFNMICFNNFYIFLCRYVRCLSYNLSHIIIFSWKHDSSNNQKLFLTMVNLLMNTLREIILVILCTLLTFLSYW